MKLALGFLIALGMVSPAFAHQTLPIPAKPQTASPHLTDCLPTVFPDSSARFTLTNGKHRAYVPIDSTVLLKPTPLSGVEIRSLIVAVNGQIMQSYELLDDQHLPACVLRVEPMRGSGVRYLDCYALDSRNHKTTLISATIFAREASDPSPKFSIQTVKERLALRLDNRKSLRNVTVYLENECLGKLDPDAETTDFDLRQLAPGRHKVQVIAENLDGELLPPTVAEFTVPPRIKIELPEPKQTYHAELDNPNMALPVRLLRSAESTARKTRLYIAGELVGEYLPDKLDVSVPLHDVYSGDVPIEAILVGADGVESPPESVTVNIKNDDWEARTFVSPYYKQVLANKRLIEQSERDAEEWATRAVYEVSSSRGITVMPIKSDRFYTVDQIDNTHLSGQAGEYWGKARAATMQMAQLLKSNGDNYITLHMIPWAKSVYARAARLAGNGTMTGQVAKAQLERLKSAKLPTPN